MKELDEDEGAIRRLRSNTKMEQDEDEGTRRR